MPGLDTYRPIDSAPHDGSLLKAMESTNERFSLYWIVWHKERQCWIDAHFKYEVHPTHWKRPNE